MDDHLSGMHVAIHLKRSDRQIERATHPFRHDLAALQRTGFTSHTGHPDWLSALTALVSPLPFLRMAVSFLWHFPYSHLRLPLAIVLLCAVRTFLTILR